MEKKLNTATSIEEIQRIPTMQERFRFINEKKETILQWRKKQRNTRRNF